MQQSPSNASPPPGRGVPWVFKLRRRCLFLPKTIHGHHRDMQPTTRGKRRKLVRDAKVTCVLCWFYVQVPQLPKQLHKPWLHPRFPSDPMRRFWAFLLPPICICIGATPCKTRQKKSDMVYGELPLSIRKLGKHTYHGLDTDRLPVCGHGEFEG
jgi:hypothetical protein